MGKRNPRIRFRSSPHDTACLAKGIHTGAVLWFCEKQVSRVSQFVGLWRGFMYYHIHPYSSVCSYVPTYRSLFLKLFRFRTGVVSSTIHSYGTYFLSIRLCNVTSLSGKKRLRIFEKYLYVEVKRGWRRLRNKVPHNFYLSPNITTVNT